MDFKDPQLQRNIIVGIFLAFTGYIFFFTSFLPIFYQPMHAKIKTLDSEYEKMAAELEKARKTVGNLAVLEAEYNRLHDKWLAAQTLLPKDREVAELLRKITRAGNQAGVEFVLFEPQKPVPKEFITENPIKIKVLGEYHQLGIFLSKVANLDRIINVSNIQIDPIAERGGQKASSVSNAYTIEVEMIMTAYTLLEGGDVPNDNEKAGKAPEKQSAAGTADGNS